MSRDRKFSGANPHNSTARELTHAKQAKMRQGSRRKPAKAALQNAPRDPKPKLIRKGELLRRRAYADAAFYRGELKRLDEELVKKGHSTQLWADREIVRTTVAQIELLATTIRS